MNYTEIFDLIKYYYDNVLLCEYNDLFGPTHPELGCIIYIWYFIRKFKGIFRS